MVVIMSLSIDSHFNTIYTTTVAGWRWTIIVFSEMTRITTASFFISRILRFVIEIVSACPTGFFFPVCTDGVLRTLSIDSDDAGLGTSVGGEDVGSSTVGVGVDTCDTARTGVGVRACCVGGCAAVEGSSVCEWAADGEDDTEGHGGGEDGCHGGDDGLDGIGVIGWLGDEPEEHVDHVHEPDCAVEVKTITEHELPVGDLFDSKGLEGPHGCEDECDCEE